MYASKKIKCIRALRNLAKSLDLVVLDYSPDAQSDIHVAGISRSIGMDDSFCAHGHAAGFEMTLLLRSFNIPSEVSSDDNLRWVILKIGLPMVRLPRLFINGGRHSVGLTRRLTHFYGNLAYGRDSFGPINPSFTENFNVFFQPHSGMEVSRYLDETLMQALYERYPLFSFEIEPEAIYSYLDADLIDEIKLAKQVEVLTWLAERCCNIYEMVHEEESSNLKLSSAASL